MKPKVFGIGLSKTGTSSLAEALNILGFKTIHYPNDEVTYHELRSGQFKLSLLDEYDGVADTPVVPYYAQFDKLYPGSKFILTIREKNAWLASVEQHWQTASTYEDEPLKKEFQQFIRTAVYGCIDFNYERFSYVYDQHCQNVLKYFAHRREDLLVMDICAGDGWKELCPFLGVPVQQTPFPHANEWMSKLIKAAESFSSFIPSRSTSILIDDRQLGESFMQGRICLPFTEKEGFYNGPPENGLSGVTELKNMITRHKPEHVVVAWPSFWWLDTYPEINHFLHQQCEKVAATEELMFFKVR